MAFGKKTSSLSIQDAIAAGLITVELTGAGGGDTSKVYLRITNLSKEAVNIEVPQGTVFSPVQGGEQ